MDELVVGQSVPLETDLSITGVTDALGIWRDLVRRSRKCIEIAAFYLMTKSGSRFDQFVNDLVSAADRGVEVKIMLDRKFFERDLDSAEEEHKLKLRGIERHDRIELRLVDVFNRIGGMLHSKMLIVDGQYVWIGSQNLDWRSLDHIMELGILCRSQSIAGVARSIFHTDWTAIDVSSNVVKKRDYIDSDVCAFMGKKHKVGIVTSPESIKKLGVPYDLDYIIRAIGSARREICLQVSKYRSIFRRTGEPWAVIENELMKAAARGVEIKLLVDRRTEDIPNQLQILKKIVRKSTIQIAVGYIPEHSSGSIPFARMLHSKMAVFDRHKMWLGTSNLGPEDFFCSRNVGFVIEGNEMAEVILRIFQKIWRSEYTKYL